MVDVRVVGPYGLAAAAARDDHQRDAVLVVGEDRMKIDVERTFRELHELAEEPVDLIPAAVVPGQLVIRILDRGRAAVKVSASR
jgi:hypothetical protein